MLKLIVKILHKKIYLYFYIQINHEDLYSFQK